MAARAFGALLATIAALLFAVAFAAALAPQIVPGWWDGHPRVDGKTIARKDLHVGLLGASGCNLGETVECQSVEIGSTIKIVGIAELAATGLVAIAAAALALSIWKLGDRRKTMAKLTIAAVMLAAFGAGALLALGPDIKASQQIAAPIGLGLYVLGGGLVCASIASVLGLGVERPPLRLKPSLQKIPPPAPLPEPDISDFLRELDVQPATPPPPLATPPPPLLATPPPPPLATPPPPPLASPSPLAAIPPSPGGNPPGPSGALAPASVPPLQPLQTAPAVTTPPRVAHDAMTSPAPTSPRIDALPPRSQPKTMPPPALPGLPRPKIAVPMPARTMPTMPPPLRADQAAGDRAQTDADHPDPITAVEVDAAAKASAAQQNAAGATPAAPSVLELSTAEESALGPPRDSAELETAARATYSAHELGVMPGAAPGQSVPISTAPASLPPPRDSPATVSGPTPACPQCEAPMVWVEEHLRFYCKQCRMYF